MARLPKSSREEQLVFWPAARHTRVDMVERIDRGPLVGSGEKGSVLFCVLPSVKVAPDSWDYQTQLRRVLAFLDLCDI